MQRCEFFNEIDAASQNHLNFANFVSRAEFLFDDRTYAEAWFEVEIVNAVALAQWEIEGKPTDWIDTWSKDFMADAIETLSLLKIAAETVSQSRAPHSDSIVSNRPEEDV